jgi:hypothetical protein
LRTLIGLDEGTSAVKAAMFDLRLRPIASVRREKRTTHPAEGLVEQDPAATLEAAVDAVWAISAARRSTEGRMPATDRPLYGSWPGPLRPSDGNRAPNARSRRRPLVTGPA